MVPVESLVAVVVVVADEVAAVAGIVVATDMDGWEDDTAAAVPDPDPAPGPDPDADSDVDADDGPAVFDIENRCLERDRSMEGSIANADLKTCEGMGSESKDWDLSTSLSSSDFDDSLSAALSAGVGLVVAVVVVVAAAEVVSVLADWRLFLLEALEWDRRLVEFEGDKGVNKGNLGGRLELRTQTS